MVREQICSNISINVLKISTNVIYCITKINEKKHMINLESIGSFQLPFMIKSLQYQKSGKYLNLIKGISQKPTVKIMLIVETLDTFFLTLRTGNGKIHSHYIYLLFYWNS